MSVHGRSTVVLGNEYDLSGNFRGATISHTIENADDTNFGDAARNRLVGLRDGALDLDGVYDAAAGGVDAVMGPLVGTGSDLYAITPGSSAEGGYGYATQFHMSTYQNDVPVDDIVGATINGDSIVGWDRVLVIHNLSAETSTGTGTIFDNSAASSNGGSAYVHVTSGTGWGTLDLDIRESTDNFVGDDTSLVTFTQATADNAKERVTFTGTVKRYVRLSYTIAGLSTVTFWVGFNRAP